jgi:hypothetical protein
VNHAVSPRLRAPRRWPSGLVQQFDGLPANHRIGLEEGSSEFRAEPFAPSATLPKGALVEQKSEQPPDRCETWLIDPLAAPEFSLHDLQGEPYTLSPLRGGHVSLNFWRAANPPCPPELEKFQRRYANWRGRGCQLLAVNVKPFTRTEQRAEFEQVKKDEDFLQAPMRTESNEATRPAARRLRRKR